MPIATKKSVEFTTEKFPSVMKLVALADPAQIRAASHGEVKNAETINFRDIRPVEGGIFDEKIFGAMGDVEDRLGHVELNAPVAHPWYKAHIAKLLAMSDSELAQELDAGRGDTLRDRLEKLDLAEETELTREEECRWILQRLQATGKRPAWMMLTAMPVLPSALRSLIWYEDGKAQASKLNDLYRRVIRRNLRIAKKRSLGAPAEVITHEIACLQKSVDDLYAYLDLLLRM